MIFFGGGGGEVERDWEREGEARGCERERECVCREYVVFFVACFAECVFVVAISLMLPDGFPGI